MECLAVDYELWDWVTVHVHIVPHTPGDLLVLHQRQEHIDELHAVWRGDGLQNLSHEVSEEIE